MGSLNPPSFRFPFPLHGQPEEVQQAHIFAFNAILDLQSANKEVSAQIAALKTATATPGTSTSTTTTVIDNPFPGLGTKNDQTGNTAYTTQTGDNGVLLILNDASPIAVGLNSVVSAPFFFFVTNFGAGTATLTPTSGLINGGASFSLPQNYFAVVVFDGTNWFTSALLVIPQNTAGAAHQWIASYNSATGVFTLSQPTFADISGNLTLGQLPTVGITVVVTTAALTTLGTQGSQTFQNGILTAQVQAT